MRPAQERLEFDREDAVLHGELERLERPRRRQRRLRCAVERVQGLALAPAEWVDGGPGRLEPGLVREAVNPLPGLAARAGEQQLEPLGGLVVAAGRVVQVVARLLTVTRDT